MKRWWLEITLRSDMCAATGDSEAGLVDIRTAVEYGLPFIPAKRIKGCLLAEGKELESSGFAEKKVLERLFGKAGSGSPGTLHIGNARLYRIPGYLLETEEPVELTPEEYEQTRRILRSRKKLSESLVEEILTVTRTMTAIDKETGTARDRTLRTIQLVPRGMVFRSSLELENGEDKEAERTLQWCVKALRHMGVGITRGFGEISCTLEADGDAAKPAVDAVAGTAGIVGGGETRAELFYEIELDSPALFAGDAGLYEDCSDQIPGAALLGVLAAIYCEEYHLGGRAHEDEGFRRIFLRGGVEFGYGFPQYGKKVFYPCPSFLAMEKESRGNAKSCLNRLLRQKEMVRRKNITSQVCLDEKRKILYLADVEKEVRIHHARPVDRRIGHAMNDRLGPGAVDMGQFFQYTALSGGQKFTGSLRGSSQDLERLRECLRKRENCFRLGRSRTAEYGGAEIRWIDPEPRAEQTSRSRRWLLWLLTPLAVVNPGTGEICPETVYWEQELQSRLGCCVTITDCILKYTRIGGYNSRWRLPSPQYRVFAQGSMAVIQSEKELTAGELENVRWGELTGRGCGQIKVLPEKWIEDDLSKWSINDTSDMSFPAEEAEDTAFITALCRCGDQNRRRRLDRDDALRQSDEELPNMTVISKLIRLMEERNNEVDTDDADYKWLESCVLNIEDDKKRYEALSFIKPCKDRSAEFIKTYLENSKWRARTEGKTFGE